MSSAPSNRRGLGRGLEVLIGGDERQELAELPVDAIEPNPRQPRRRFEPEAAAGLAASVRHAGLLQPVVVRPRTEGGWELIAGERRWRAARRAGLATVPVLVKEATPQQQLELALVENIQRADLDAVEEARAYRTLADEFGLTHEQIARRVGKSRPLVTQMLGLLRLPSAVQELVSNGSLSLGHVRPLLSLKDGEAQQQAARMIVFI